MAMPILIRSSDCVIQRLGVCPSCLGRVGDSGYCNRLIWRAGGIRGPLDGNYL